MHSLHNYIHIYILANTYLSAHYNFIKNILKGNIKIFDSIFSSNIMPLRHINVLHASIALLNRITFYGLVKASLHVSIC